jgi:subtilase family serine protease
MPHSAFEEAAMNAKNSGNRGPRHARALAVAAAVTLLVPGCSVAHVHFGSSPAPAATVSASYQQLLAYARCMRAHGLPDFPTPLPSAGSRSTVRQSGNASGPAARANAACEHLLTGASRGPAAATTASPPGARASDCLTSQQPCYTPKQLRVAYGIQPLLDRGITGRGQTVVLPEFPPSASADSQVPPAASDIRQDLTRFDRLFGLPAAQLQVVNSLAHAASPWEASAEEVADTEIVHALAPGAAIKEVLIPSADTASTATVNAAAVAALRLSLTQGGVISFSAGAGEQCFTPAQAAQWNSVLQSAQRDRVTVAISASDFGATATACPPGTGSTEVKGVDLPASDPLALAVGGTSLRASRTTGAYTGETAWSTPPAGGPNAGGGGFSRLFSRPAYQDGISGTETTRGVPDVAADADPASGMALAFTAGGQNYLIASGGNSAATPLWAAVIALADQYAGRDLGFINPALYLIGRSAQYHQAFHDVTTGSNTVTFATGTVTGYRAAPGWDPVTGWGSPNVQALVPLLARYAST